jgi:acetyl-CoA carboxylase carboxyltransferase component
VTSAAEDHTEPGAGSDSDSGGTWAPDVDELHRREALAREMGGPDKIERQHTGGKLTVRERIDALLDPGSFHEIGALAGRATYEDGELAAFTASNFVMGRGRIDHRPVVVGGDDFTVRGGAADASIWQKQVYAEQMAHELRLPIVRLVDGTGGGGSVKSLDTERRTYVPPLLGWQHTVDNLANVPVVALALGSVAGLGAARVVNSHYALMVRETSQIFVAGPPVVARVGEPVTKEDLGGDQIHGRNGVVDDVVESEVEAFDRTRQFLSYLPSSVHEMAPRSTPTDDPERRDEWLLSAIPRATRQVYKMRPIIESVVDAGSWFEIGRGWGRAAVCGLARLDGWPVAVLASDPYQSGGSWTADASDKVTRFVDLADTFHLPVVHLVDQPGFMVGVEGERAGTIRSGVRAVAAIHQADVPWCSVLIRKVFGVGGAGHQSSARLSYRFAWPSGSWGSLPVEGGVEAAFRAELDALPDDEARQARIAEITARMDSVRSPFRTAEAFLVEEIIDPRDTRPMLCEFANLAAPLREPGVRTHTYRP